MLYFAANFTAGLFQRDPFSLVPLCLFVESMSQTDALPSHCTNCLLHKVTQKTEPTCNFRPVLFTNSKSCLYPVQSYFPGSTSTEPHCTSIIHSVEFHFSLWRSAHNSDEWQRNSAYPQVDGHTLHAAGDQDLQRLSKPFRRRISENPISIHLRVRGGVRLSHFPQQQPCS